MHDSILAKINEIIGSGTGCPSAEDVAHLEAAYPYFVLPAAIRLARAESMTDSERAHLQLRVALASGDRETLFTLADELGSEFAGFYPPDDKPSAPTTDSAIDTFLEKYGKTDPDETALLEKLIFHPVAEYAATLEREQEDAPVGQDAVLAAFLKEFSPEEKKKQAQQEERRRKALAEKKKKNVPSEDSLLSESLAKIYISRGKYDKAYEIIRSLSLKYPKKSIYFADQLRFLQKLILNSKHKK